MRRFLMLSATVWGLGLQASACTPAPFDRTGQDANRVTTDAPLLPPDASALEALGSTADASNESSPDLPTDSRVAASVDAAPAMAIGPGGGTVNLLSFAVLGDTRPTDVDIPSEYP